MVFENLKHVLIYNYLKNKELNYFYLSIALINFGVALISIFIPIYLYKIGYPIYKIIFFYILWSVYYLIFLYPGTKAISKIGVKHSILLSTIFLIIYYGGLNFLDKIPILFFILPMINAINTVFYWNSYHLLFILKADKKKRGKEISFISIITFLSISLAPFFGGLIAKEAFALLFSIGSIFVLLSSIPLFITKEYYCSHNFTIKSLFKDFLSKKEKYNILSFSGYAIESIIQAIIWPIYLIIILGTYAKTGLIVTITTLFSVIGLYISGLISDKFNKIKLIRFWTIFHSFGWFARIFADSFLKIFIIDSYKLLTEKFLQIPWTTQIYTLADKRDYYNFIVLRHFVLHFVRIIVLPFLMIIFFIDFYPFITSFIIAGVFSLFYRFIQKK